nr:hypothetical protein [Tanacetum cinerariifolium]
MLSKHVEKTTHVSLAPGVILGPSSGVSKYLSLTIPDTSGMAAPPFVHFVSGDMVNQISRIPGWLRAPGSHYGPLVSSEYLGKNVRLFQKEARTTDAVFKVIVNMIMARTTIRRNAGRRTAATRGQLKPVNQTYFSVTPGLKNSQASEGVGKREAIKNLLREAAVAMTWDNFKTLMKGE